MRVRKSTALNFGVKTDTGIWLVQRLQSVLRQALEECLLLPFYRAYRRSVSFTNMRVSNGLTVVFK